MKHAGTTPSTHQTNFDAIRMMAALAVLYSHHFALTGQMEPSAFGLHSWGGMAVIIFFVISGYLVTASWYNDPHFLRFSWRRILRIWPALIAVTTLTAYVLGAWVTSLPLAEYWQHPATLDYLRIIGLKIHFVLPGVFEHNPYPLGVNGSLWTIPLEIRCYAVLALCGLLGLMRSHMVWLTAIAVFMTWFMLKSNADLTGHMHYGHTLSAFFLAGSALFILQRFFPGATTCFAVVALLATCLWLLNWKNTALLLVLPCLVIYAGTRSTPIVRRFGRWGDPSYGLYLFAYPVQQTVLHFFWPQLGFLQTMILAVVITVALAYTSWHLLEKQALRLKPKRPFAPLPTAATRPA